MVLWISGIVEAENGDAFFQTMSTVQPRLDELGSRLSAEEAVEKIRMVFVINQDSSPKEYRRYDAKTRTLDARIRIDYAAFQRASPAQRVTLFVEAMVGTLQKTSNPSTKDFHKEAVCRAISTIDF